MLSTVTVFIIVGSCFSVYTMLPVSCAYLMLLVTSPLTFAPCGRSSSQKRTIYIPHIYDREMVTKKSLAYSSLNVNQFDFTASCSCETFVIPTDVADDSNITSIHCNR